MLPFTLLTLHIVLDGFKKKNYKSVVIVIQEVKAYTQAQTAHGTSALLQTFPAADVLTLILR